MSLPDDFVSCFERLTDHAPFGWQARLYERLRAGDIPPACDIPTGLGKTSVIALWLLALAEQASQRGTPLTLPRRLVYVVNRRVVVDQATDDAKHLFDNLHAAQDGPLFAVADALRHLAVLPADKPAKPGESAGPRPPFALSTLRGQFADNRAWSADPCRPAIIVGTVDMIGSRLLFSAYRAGYKTKPLYAAFLGQDTLVVHDEAHLEPAFQKLLDDLRAEQRRSADARPIQVMQLSATTRRGAPENGFTLEPEDEVEEKVAERLRAAKRLMVHPAVDTKQLPERLADLAFRHHGPDVAVLVFARRLDTVEKTAEALRNKMAKALGEKAAEDQVQTLTGTMRGLERDGLADDPVFRRFLKPPASGWSVPVRPGTVYLVCTSAGEVGVDLSANHLVSDLTTFESMAQRFGRVNRFGKFFDTQVDVVPTDSLNPDDAERLAATEAILARLDGDASPAALRRLRLKREEREAAFSREPVYLETSGILFDAWALTSITDPLPGRPPVEFYLHGMPDENERPTTQVAWRDEVERLTDKDGHLLAPFRDEDLKTLLADYPLKPQELLQDRSYRVAEILAKLAKRKPENLKLPVWLQDNREEISSFTFGSLLDKRNKDKIDHNLLLLPPCLGGLFAGMLDPGSDTAADVSNAWLDENRQPRRQRLWTAVHEEPVGMEKMRLIRCIDARPDSPDDPGEEAEPSADRFWWWYEAPAGADTEGSSYARKAVALSVHTGDVQELARQFAAKLGLPPELAEAIYVAGKFHDHGKDRRDWQQSIGNFGFQALAKSDGKKSTRAIPTDYRHEFGSLLDLLAAPEFQALSEEAQDLVLHLIAAHHGRARPHFDPEEIFDRQHPKPDRDALAAETPRRFARLQRRHGRWGLAFLESLLRAADYAASANPSATVGDAPQP